MRAWLIRVLHRLLAWLEPVVIPEPDPLLVAARQAVTLMQTVERGLKRHTQLVRGLMVTALLKRQFPDRRTRDLNWAREQAVQELTIESETRIL